MVRKSKGGPVKKAAPIKKAASKTGGKSSAPQPTRDPKKNEFMSAVAAMASRWREAREKQASTFETPDIDDGVYEAQVTDAVGSVRERIVNGKKVKVPQVRFTVIVTEDGEYNGLTLYKECPLSNPYVDAVEDRSLEFLAKTIHGMGYDACDIDFSKAASVSSLMESVRNDQPAVQISVKNRIDKNGIDRMDFYVNRPLDDDDEE